ncbi:MAG: hypothetical protein HJJLKODD_00042 [Phycisphaerae bacterium]|nr:hypothetical protein [Phycisphaerae bacterium]
MNNRQVWFWGIGVIAGLMLGLPSLAQDEAAPAEQPLGPEGIPLVHWEDAAKFYNKEVVIYGRVAVTKKINKYTFINFAPDYRSTFTMLIHNTDAAQFPESPDQLYARKIIAIRGVVIDYKKKPEIIVKHPDQVMILPDETEDVLAILKTKIPTANGRSGSGATATGISSDRVTLATLDMSKVLGSDAAFCTADEATAPTIAAAQAAGGLIELLSPDVLVITNSRDLACVQQFNSKLLGKLGYQQVSGEPNPTTHYLDVAVLSRLPQSNTRQMHEYINAQDGQVPFMRPPLETELTAPDGRRILLLAVNQPTEKELPKVAERNGEFKGLRRRVEEQLKFNPGLEIIVAGQFNETIDSKTLALLLGDGATALAAPGYTPISATPQEKPLIAQITHLILGSPQCCDQYLNGTTRIEQNAEVGTAVAISLRCTPTTPVEPAAPSDQEESGTGGGF